MKKRNFSIATLKRMNYRELGELAYQLREEIIRAVSINGGHLSSNLGVIEIEMALMRYYDFPHDKLLFDVGHQSYAYKLLSGRNLDTLRKKDGISGFQKRDESPFDVFEAGHSSTSLSAALGMAIARDLKREQYSIIALIGDASIVNGMALEALNDIGSQNHKVIIVLNDNDMSVSKTVGAIQNHSRNISSVYEHFGLDYIGPVDGHDIKTLEKAFKEAESHERSVVIHAYTEKGRGYSFAQEDTLGVFHGIKPFKVQTGEQIDNHARQTSYSSFFGSLIDEYMGEDQKVTLICPAMVLGSGLVTPFNKYSSRCFDVGIAEEHALTLASGMALNGIKPIVSIYSTFLQRAFDQLSHDVCRMNLDVMLLIDRAGLVGEDGETHQGLYDEGFIFNTPNITLVAPSDMKTSRALFNLGKTHKGPYAIRYPRSYFPLDDKDGHLDLKFGTWLVPYRQKDSKVALITYGSLVDLFRKQLETTGIKADLYNALFLKPFDKNALDKMLNKDHIFIMNSMATRHGFVQEVIEYLVGKNYKGQIHPYYVPDEFIKQATIGEQLTDSHVNIDYLLSEIKKVL